MKSATRKKLITCIVPHGRALPVLKTLNDEHGIITANIYHARGSGRMTPMAWRGVGETSEKDIMSVVVDEADSEVIFSLIYELAGIHQPHGGIMYQQTLKASTDYTLPNLPPEEQSIHSSD
jgi:hypothetical protein